MSYMTNNRERKRRMETNIDNLILNVLDVTPYQFETFAQQLEIAETYGKIPRVKREIGVGVSKYHHIVRIGEGAGAIHIGYKHNSSPEAQNAYKLRLEVNPSKATSEQMAKAREWAVQIFANCFATNTKMIKGVDIAYDVPIAMDRLFVASMTGRKRQIVKGTIYYGERGQNGNLKIYDKKKELSKKQGIQVSEEHLTRIEFSLRLEDPITFQLFSKLDKFGINDLYQVSELNIGKADGVVKACLIAVSSGEMQMGELSRTYQNKTKRALADMGLLDLDHAYTNAQKEILDVIRQYLTITNDTILQAV